MSFPFQAVKAPTVVLACFCSPFRGAAMRPAGHLLHRDSHRRVCGRLRDSGPRPSDSLNLVPVIPNALPSLNSLQSRTVFFYFLGFNEGGDEMEKKRTSQEA